MRATLIWFLVLALVGILTASCTTAKEGHSSKENAGHVSEKATSLEPSQIPSGLLPTLEVAVDSCYVFLQPKRQSPYFGPLVKGEKIKRLDAYGNWLRIWIPRLKVSGWIRRTKVYATSKPTSSQGNVPENLLSTVTVLTKRANIREAPAMRSSIILEARKSQAFLVLNEKKGWYQIWVPELKKKGWIFGGIVTRKRKK